MKYVLPLFTVMLLIGCDSPRANLEPVSANKALSTEELAEIAKAEITGKEIFQKDKLAAFGTDIVHSQPIDLSKRNVKGWIVVNLNGADVIRFIKETDDGFKPAFDVVFNKNNEGAFVENPSLPFTEDQKAMFVARQTALGAVVLPCEGPYNTVVLQAPDSNEWHVYLLAATTDPKKVMLAGHSMVAVSSDGTKVAAVIPLSKSCLAMEMPPPSSSKEPAALYVTHILSDMPTPAHVYLNYLHGYPIYVTTKSGRMWLISKGQIFLLNGNVYERKNK